MGGLGALTGVSVSPGDPCRVSLEPAGLTHPFVHLLKHLLAPAPCSREDTAGRNVGKVLLPGSNFLGRVRTNKQTNKKVNKYKKIIPSGHESYYE